MNKFFDAIGTGLGYLDQGVQLYGNIFGGSGSTFGGSGSGTTPPPYITPPYAPPSSGTTSQSGTDNIGGMSVSTLVLIGLAVLLLKR